MQGAVDEVAALIGRGDYRENTKFFRSPDCGDETPLLFPGLLAIGKRYFIKNGLRVVRHTPTLRFSSVTGTDVRGSMNLYTHRYALGLIHLC